MDSAALRHCLFLFSLLFVLSNTTSHICVAQGNVLKLAKHLSTTYTCQEGLCEGVQLLVFNSSTECSGNTFSGSEQWYSPSEAGTCLLLTLQGNNVTSFVPSCSDELGFRSVDWKYDKANTCPTNFGVTTGDVTYRTNYCIRASPTSSYAFTCTPDATIAAGDPSDVTAPPTVSDVDIQGESIIPQNIPYYDTFTDPGCTMRKELRRRVADESGKCYLISPELGNYRRSWDSNTVTESFSYGCDQKPFLSSKYYYRQCSITPSGEDYIMYYMPELGVPNNPENSTSDEFIPAATPTSQSNPEPSSGASFLLPPHSLFLIFVILYIIL